MTVHHAVGISRQENSGNMPSRVNIITCDGHKLPWSYEIRYLGTHIVQSRQLKCSLDYAKKSFFRSLNAICGKIGRNACDEVILELIRSKCIPILILMSKTSMEV